MESQIQQKLVQKTRELENLRELEQLTKNLNISLEEFGSQLELLESESSCIGTVTENWIRIIRCSVPRNPRK